MAVSVRCSRNVATVLLLVSSFSAKWRTSWVLVIPEAMNPPVNQCLNFSRGCILYHGYCGKEVFSAAIHAVFLHSRFQNSPKNRLFQAGRSEIALPTGPRRHLCYPGEGFSAWDNEGYRRIQVSCVICEKRKEKRFCPEVHGRICPQCCGENPEITLDCPSDCVYLQ